MGIFYFHDRLEVVQWRNTLNSNKVQSFVVQVLFMWSIVMARAFQLHRTHPEATRGIIMFRILHYFLNLGVERCIEGNCNRNVLLQRCWSSSGQNFYGSSFSFPLKLLLSHSCQLQSCVYWIVIVLIALNLPLKLAKKKNVHNFQIIAPFQFQEWKRDKNSLNIRLTIPRGQQC